MNLGKLVCCFLLILVHFSASSAVILQYHHVSNETPDSTSITPEQFEVHMQYLQDNEFNVVPLSDIVDALKQQKPLGDKVVAITFDDAYTDIIEQGKPILDKFDFPFTVFVNPGLISDKAGTYMSWQQIKALSDDGVIIANHGFEHDSLARISKDQSTEAWLAANKIKLIKAEEIIEKHTGQSWRYFAYPYGEYTPEIQQWIADNKFIGFTQQSGAVGLATNTTAIPRYPASKPYDQLSSLRDKLNSLPFIMTFDEENSQTVHKYKSLKQATFNINTDDFHKAQLNCYISGLGRQLIEWQNDKTFTIKFTDNLPSGRVRCNCTAPSTSKPGRYYWHSKPWFVLKENGQWYPL